MPHNICNVCCNLYVVLMSTIVGKLMAYIRAVLWELLGVHCSLLDTLCHGTGLVGVIIVLK